MLLTKVVGDGDSNCKSRVVVPRNIQDMNKSSKEVSLHKDARIVLIIGSMKTKADSDNANSTVNISPVDSNRDSIMETARIRSKMSKDGAHDRHADKSECLEETF